MPKVWCSSLSLDRIKHDKNSCHGFTSLYLLGEAFILTCMCVFVKRFHLIIWCLFQKSTSIVSRPMMHLANDILSALQSWVCQNIGFISKDLEKASYSSVKWKLSQSRPPGFCYVSDCSITLFAEVQIEVPNKICVPDFIPWIWLARNLSEKSHEVIFQKLCP